jgi:hypothetical protein
MRWMVGPCGLEPQTSTVSIQKAMMTQKAVSSHKCKWSHELSSFSTLDHGQQRTRKDSTFLACPGRVMAQTTSQNWAQSRGVREWPELSGPETRDVGDASEATQGNFIFF